MLAGSEQASVEKARLERLGYVVMYVLREPVKLAGNHDGSPAEAEY